MSPDEIDRFYAELGQRIRAAREGAGLTQQQLAAALDLTRSSVANIEAGRQKPLMHVAAAVASVTGVPAAELLPGPASVAASPSLARDLRRLSEPNREAVEMLLRRTALASG